MNSIYTCEYPTIVVNPYTKEKILHRCGYCSACQNARKNEIVSKLHAESKKWKHAIFFTLTYDEEHLVRVDVVRNNSEVTMGIVFKYDIQLFLKRLRKRIYSDMQKDSIALVEKCIKCDSSIPDKDIVSLFNQIKLNYETQKIRYFICSEYGSKNGRPHYHGIIFTDSDSFALHAYPLLCTSWKNGFVNCSPAGTKSFGYVAKYVKGTSGIPFVTENGSDLEKASKPFTCSSTLLGHPSLTDGIGPLEEIVLGGLTDIIVEQDGRLSSIHLWKSLESRLFPKCRGFNTLSFSGRLAQYARYANESSSSIKNQLRLTYMSDEEWKQHVDAQLRDMYISKKFFSLCRQFNLTPEDYLKQIQLYYDKKARLGLGEFYKKQEEYAKEHDYHFLVHMYDELVYKLRSPLPLATSALSTFGDMTKEEFSARYEFCFDPEYDRFVKEQNRIFDAGQKTKELNDSIGLLDN